MSKNQSYETYQSMSGTPIKAWTRGVLFDEKAQKQVQNVASLPFIHGWVAIMPDVHWGMGATIGSVIPTFEAIIPAAVGVDIGCGMMAVQTTLTASDLPDNLGGLRSDIEARAVPHGRSSNGRRRPRLVEPSQTAFTSDGQTSRDRYDALVDAHQNLAAPTASTTLEPWVRATTSLKCAWTKQTRFG